VSGDDTWEGSLRRIITDARYGALKTLGEKRHAFNEFVQVRLGGARCGRLDGVLVCIVVLAWSGVARLGFVLFEFGRAVA